MSSKHIFSSGTLALKLISIRVSDPGVVRRTGAGTRVQVMRVIREPADVRGGTGRGRRRRVAFPRGEIFDIVKTGWRFDPFNHLFYSNHPDVSTSKYVLEELFHRCEWKYKTFILVNVGLGWRCSYSDTVIDPNYQPGDMTLTAMTPNSLTSKEMNDNNRDLAI